MVHGVKYIVQCTHSLLETLGIRQMNYFGFGFVMILSTHALLWDPMNFSYALAGQTHESTKDWL